MKVLRDSRAILKRMLPPGYLLDDHLTGKGHFAFTVTRPDGAWRMFTTSRTPRSPNIEIWVQQHMRRVLKELN